MAAAVAGRPSPEKPSSPVPATEVITPVSASTLRMRLFPGIGDEEIASLVQNYPRRIHQSGSGGDTSIPRKSECTQPVCLQRVAGRGRFGSCPSPRMMIPEPSPGRNNSGTRARRRGIFSFSQLSRNHYQTVRTPNAAKAGSRVQKRQLLDSALGGQYTVEGLAVGSGQSSRSLSVDAADGQLLKTGPLHPAGGPSIDYVDPSARPFFPDLYEARTSALSVTSRLLCFSIWSCREVILKRGSETLVPGNRLFPTEERKDEI